MEEANKRSTNTPKFRHKLLKAIKDFGPVIITLLVFTFIISSELLPNTVSIEQGEPAKQDIVAYKTVVNRYVTTRLSDDVRRNFIREESNSEKYYQINAAFSYQAEEMVDDIFSMLKVGQDSIASISIADVLKRRTETEENAGVIQKQIADKYILLGLSRDEVKQLIGASTENFMVIWQNATITAGSIMRGERITNDGLGDVKNGVSSALEAQGVHSDYIKAVAKIVSMALAPNLSLDVAALDEAAEAQAKLVEPVYIQENQIVVRRGDIVTDEHMTILQDLGMLNTRDNLRNIIAIFLMVAMILGISIAYYLHYLPKNLVKTSNAMLMCLVAMFTMAISQIIMQLLPVQGIYLMPVAFTGIVIAVLIDPVMGIVASISMSLAVSLVAGGNLFVGIFAMTGSVVGILNIKNFTERRKLLKTIGLIALSLAMVAICYNLATGEPLSTNIFVLPILNGIIVNIICMGTLPLLEMLFGVVSNMRLLELLNSSHPLLHRMMFEAPGTYQHSVNTANLAETAANALGLNSLLVRVGAQYHDCGKLKRPYFFIENQLNKVNPHDKIAPSLSTLVIVSHVKDGVELAKQYGLPKPVIDIINEHHGNSLVTYFYHQATEKDKEHAPDEKYFRYPGPKPQTRESALVMLADSTEAAVRSLAEPTPWNIRNMIHKIIWNRLDELDECDLTFKDLNLIEEAFYQIMSGVHHVRIEYPDGDSKGEKKDEIVLGLDIDEKDYEEVFKEKMNDNRDN